MNIKNRNWSTGFTRPYYKVYPFLKENKSNLGYLIIVELILYIAAMAVIYLLNIISQLFQGVIQVAVFLVLVYVALLIISFGFPKWTILFAGIETWLKN